MFLLIIPTFGNDSGKKNNNNNLVDDKCSSAALCPQGSCFQMTPGRELSLDICITRTCFPVTSHGLTSVVASFLLGWDPVTSIWAISWRHRLWQAPTLTARDGQKMGMWVYAADGNDEKGLMHRESGAPHQATTGGLLQKQGQSFPIPMKIEMFQKLV